MTANLTASDLMLRDFEQIGAEATLGEAMDALLAVQAAANRPHALVVVDQDGGYVGVLTARLLFRGLLTLWAPGRSVRADEELLERQLLDVVEERAAMRVRDALVRGLPTAGPADRLLALVDLACDKRLEFVPVVEAGRLVGLVPVTSLLQATAALALKPEDEGIQF